MNEQNYCRRSTSRHAPSRRVDLEGLKIAVAALGFFFAGVASAVTIFWANPAGGLYLTSSNWLPAAVPTGSESPIFDLPGTYLVTMPSMPFPAVELEVRNGSVTFDFVGSANQHIVVATAGIVGGSAAATFTRGIDDNTYVVAKSGGIVTVPFNLLASAVTAREGGLVVVNGRAAGEVQIRTGGNVTFNGPATSNLRRALLFEGGNKTLLVQNAAHVNLLDSQLSLELSSISSAVVGQANLTIDGSSSSLTSIVTSLAAGGGAATNSTVVVSNAGLGQFGRVFASNGSKLVLAKTGGVVTTGAMSLFASGAPASLTLTAESGGSITTGSVSASSSTLTLTAESGGSITTDSLLASGANLNVNGGTVNETFQVVQSISVDGGSAELNGRINAGGLHGAGHLDLIHIHSGADVTITGDTGSITEDGGLFGLLVIDGSLTLKPTTPNGQSDILNNGEIRVVGNLTLTNGNLTNATPQGLISVQGGTVSALSVTAPVGGLQVAGQLITNVSLTGSATLSVPASSQMTLSGPLSNNGAGVNVASGALAIYQGPVSGSSSFTGTGTNQFSGGFAPGNSPAAVSIQGNVVLNSGNTLYIELGGLTSGFSYDVVNVGGNAALGGTLNVSLIDGFVPQLGDTFDILVAGTASGAFLVQQLPSLAPGLMWKLQVVTNQASQQVVRLSVAQLDSDADGVANVSDNCTVEANPTQLDADSDGYGNLCDADLNNSGTVTTADFGLLRSVLGQPASASATAAAADMNGSGTVTTADFGLLRARLGTAPGPSGLHP